MELETELARLKSLFDKGLIDETEYREEKKALLSSSRPSGSTPPPLSGSPLGTAMSLVAGMTIGPDNKRVFRLEKKLGGGAMGEVWKAEDMAESKIVGHTVWVAVKALIPFLSAGERHREALKREAINAKKLSHAHIIRTHDWYEDKSIGSFPFLVMEYLEGQTLDQKLAQAGHFTYAETLSILKPIVEALTYAWEEHRIVHRDLKPDNIYLTAEGKLKLLDFGIAAQVRNTASAVGLSGFDSPGTLGYAPPEAGANRKPDPRFDIYGLGILSYELLEGQLPFNGLRQTTTPLPEKPEALNEAQWQVMQQAMAFDAQERHGSAESYLSELQHAAGPSSEDIERQEREEEAKRQAEEAAEGEAKKRAREELRSRDEAKSRLQSLEEAAKREAEEETKRRLCIVIGGRTYKPGDDLPPDFDGAPQMVVIPPGRFLMGSLDGKCSNECPQHEVVFDYWLAVAKYPVTFDEWDCYAAEVKEAHKPSDEVWERGKGWGRGRRPVFNVSFHDAESYCTWLSKKTGGKCRLLSEAEWEYACRAETTTEYYWGNSEIDIGKYAIYEGNTKECKTEEVGAKLPNDWGLYDMSGNVWEWTQDCWNNSYRGAPSDGSAWKTGDCSQRVLRGGSPSRVQDCIRVATRYYSTTSDRSYEYGFRIARTLP